MDPQNNRRYPRVHLEGGVCIDDGKELARADIHDLTVHGIAFYFYRSLEVELEFTVGFPNTPEIKHVFLQARGVRCLSPQDEAEKHFFIAPSSLK